MKFMVCKIWTKQRLGICQRRYSMLLSHPSNAFEMEGAVSMIVYSGARWNWKSIILIFSLTTFFSQYSTWSYTIEPTYRAISLDGYRIIIYRCNRPYASRYFIGFPFWIYTLGRIHFQTLIFVCQLLNQRCDSLTLLWFNFLMRNVSIYILPKKKAEKLICKNVECN